MFQLIKSKKIIDSNQSVYTALFQYHNKASATVLLYWYHKNTLQISVWMCCYGDMVLAKFQE